MIYIDENSKYKTLFPLDVPNGLIINEEGLYSSSTRYMMKNIFKLIRKYLKCSLKDLQITDANGCVGISSISFCQKVKFVNIIEIDKGKIKYIKNNLERYDLDNFKIYNKDYTKIMKKIKQDVIFLDPPWGGPDYIDESSLDLYLSEIPISEIINDLYDHVELIILKIPLNFNYISKKYQKWKKEYNTYSNFGLIVFYKT
jgi:hypothetical protein